MKPGDWLQSLTSAERKEVAVARGLFAYFPDALALVARHSVRSNEKHNPGEPVHWSREKSSDHEDCIGRHSLAVAIDPDSLDGTEPHIICRTWRSLAALQEWAEKQKKEVARQAPADATDWRPWGGSETGAPPVDPETYVLVRFLDGSESEPREADQASSWYWKHDGDSCDIVAYKVVGEVAPE